MAAAEGGGRIRRFLLGSYRLALLAAIAGLIRDHHVRLRIDGDRPITLEEIRPYLPGAARLSADPSERAGLHVRNGAGERIGYVVRTAPACDRIVGYCGPADSLVAFDRDLRVVGVRLRRSPDTAEHLADVANHPRFLKTWNGLTWDEAARDPEEAGIEGVSGATMTSLCIAEGVARRLRDGGAAPAPAPFRGRARDAGLALLVAAAVVLSFTRLRRQAWLRRSFQIAVIGYAGFYGGDLIAQSLLAGWASTSVPWRTSAGLVLLVGAALALPLASGRPVYCTQICPYGGLQELLGRLTPWRVRLPASLKRGLRWGPGLLLGFCLTVVLLNVPFKLGSVEPFEAFLLRSTALPSLVLAAAGLAASAVLPRAYCKYGCPTGALLEFVRTRGRADRLGARDAGAAGMLALSLFLHGRFHEVWAFLRSVLS